MKRKKLSDSIRWLTLFFFICGSCGEDTIENHQKMMVLNVNTQETHLSSTGEMTLELPEKGPGLGLVTSITVAKDYVLILDGLRKSVDVFDTEGKYKWSIGSRGNEKDNYKIPKEIAVIPNVDQVLIYDAGTGRILRFSMRGEFLGTVKLVAKRFIMRMLVTGEHNLIYTYADKNKNGILCVSSLETGEDLMKFKVSDPQYDNLFSFFGRIQGLTYDEAQRIIYFSLPWEEKIMGIDLRKKGFLKNITLNQPRFVNIPTGYNRTGKELANSMDDFSRLTGMQLISSGNLLLRYQFNDPSQNEALILLSDFNSHAFAQEVKNEMHGYEPFACHGMAVYKYTPPADGENTNGKIRIYRLIKRH